MEDVVIVSAKRTAIGSFGGAFKNVSAVNLGTIVVREALREIDLNPNEVDEVIFGNVLSAGLGQNVARQISVNAGIPIEKSSFTVNKVCGSGLKAVSLAAQAIALGEADVIVAGGTENMSQAPYILPNARWGYRMNDNKVVDTVVNDGLTDAFNNYHMGITAENIAYKYGISRSEQDKLALRSQHNAENAIKEGKFKAEIVPVAIKDRKGNVSFIDTDEYVRMGATVEGLEKLRPVFKKDGTVTAGNASGVNDGAAVLILMSKAKAEKLGIKPLVTIKSYASAGVSPEIMGTGPIASTIKALEKLNISVNDIGLIEANEAFAAQALSVIDGLDIDMKKVNVNGGAIALGHPVGASGARILVTLIHEMIKREVKMGLATLCIGGGQGISMIVER